MLPVFSKTRSCFQPLDRQPPARPDVALSGLLSPSVPWHSPRPGAVGIAKWWWGGCGAVSECRRILSTGKMLGEKKDFRGCEAGGRSNQGQICLITMLLLRFEFQRARGHRCGCMCKMPLMSWLGETNPKTNEEGLNSHCCWDELYSVLDVYVVFAEPCCHKPFSLPFQSLIFQATPLRSDPQTFALFKRRGRKTSRTSSPAVTHLPALRHDLSMNT